jgi:hypothetical protein
MAFAAWDKANPSIFKDTEFAGRRLMQKIPSVMRKRHRPRSGYWICHREQEGEKDRSDVSASVDGVEPDAEYPMQTSLDSSGCYDWLTDI